MREPAGAGGVAFSMNRWCRSGGDVGAGRVHIVTAWRCGARVVVSAFLWTTEELARTGKPPAAVLGRPQKRSATRSISSLSASPVPLVRRVPSSPSTASGLICHRAPVRTVLTPRHPRASCPAYGVSTPRLPGRPTAVARVHFEPARRPRTPCHRLRPHLRRVRTRAARWRFPVRPHEGAMVSLRPRPDGLGITRMAPLAPHSSYLLTPRARGVCAPGPSIGHRTHGVAQSRSDLDPCTGLGVSCRRGEAQPRRSGSNVAPLPTCRTPARSR